MKTYLLTVSLILSKLLLSQNIEFSDIQFKGNLLMADWNNTIAKDINGNYVNIDQNNDDEISYLEAENIAELRLDVPNITDIREIQYFSNLNLFSSSFGNIELTNFSGLEYLEEIDLRFNAIADIELTNLPNLKVLNLNGNYLLGEFGGYNLPMLENLDVGGCNLSNLDLTNLPNLQFLYSAVNIHESINFPNNNHIKYMFLDGAQINHLNTELVPELDSIDVSDTNLENLDFSNHQNIKKIIANNLDSLEDQEEDFFNLQGCTSLEYFEAINNYGLGHINFNGLHNLKYIYLGENSIETLDLSNLPNLEEIFTFSQELEDVNFLNTNNLRIVEITSTKISEIEIHDKLNLTRLTIISDELENFYLSNCPNLEILDLTATIIDNLDLTALSNLRQFKGDYGGFEYINFSGLTELQSVELYSCQNLVGLNLQNCSSLDNLQTLMCTSLNEIDLSCSPHIQTASLDSNLEFLNLSNGVDNSETLSLNNWLNFENLVVGVDFNEHFSQFSENVTQTPYLTLETPCSFNSISGLVKASLDNNSCDGGNYAGELKMKMISEGETYETFTDQNGFYVFYTNSQNIELSYLDETGYWQSIQQMPINIVFNQENSDIIQDICLTSNEEIRDLSISIIPITQANPGFEVSYKVLFQNKGTVSQNGKVKLVYEDAYLELINSTPNYTTINGNSLEWNFEELLPFESREIDLIFLTNSPQDSPPLNNGDVLFFQAEIVNNDNTDNNPNDNIFDLNQTVTGSYDPNDKTCLEGVTISTDQVGEYLHYLIRFENTGTAEARNIVVRDILNPAYFDLSTLQLIDASHECRVNVEQNNNSVEFIFENINLPFPPSELRHGYVFFKLKTLETLDEEDFVSNFADIYFDFNYPITTNDYVTTVGMLNIDEVGLLNEIVFFPNPIQNSITFELTKGKMINADIYNSVGQKISSEKVENNILDMSKYSKGLYYLSLFSNEGKVFKVKIIKK